MMKSFEDHQFNLARCKQEVNELKKLLADSDELGETKHIRPFFRARKDLSAFIGSYNSNIARFDQIAFEYNLFGDFASDLVVGDREKCAYNFVEFEDAGPNSLFVKEGGRAARAWSPRLEHGFGQIIDWFYRLHDFNKSDSCQARFGKRSIDFTGTLVVGRDQHMDDGERLRLEWRRRHVVVNSRAVFCVTFDELLDDLQSRLELYSRAAPVAKEIDRG